MSRYEITKSEVSVTESLSLNSQRLEKGKKKKANVSVTLSIRLQICYIRENNLSSGCCIFEVFEL